MFSKKYLSRLLALVLVLVIGLIGCGSSPSGLTGNYSQDTLAVLQNLSTAINLSNDAPNKKEVVTLARQQISDYASRYRRDAKTAGLRSFTTMQTALNALAGYYSSYGIRPLPDKLKQRLQQEFKQVEISLKRGV
ncbi:MAG: photosystem II protein Psb27 [Stanieria sp.]|uniref:Photosystem II lipoprotein Psb27 n=1 Tax=Stanieria cyanosphaera (strain ATCC 29371 / PCC 7437) TaxID=111780 RepID=K9XNW7_STAC7|nr:photosystem II protein Psb27 [Stanieria cyanosphaera]AFZ33736.1 photosystem II protein Psb27 [Stanieria cyanosphaera PCC 7437]